MSSSSALRQASNKLPVLTEFINQSSPPRLGNIEILPDIPTPELLSHTEQIVEASPSP